MKKILLALLVLPLFFACSNSDSDSGGNSGFLEVKLITGEVYNMPKGDYSIKLAPNDFVASVNAFGEIKGIRGGKTAAVLESSDNTYHVSITVAPKTSLYIDLGDIIRLNMSKDNIVKAYGEPNRITDKGLYVYDKKLFEEETLFGFNEDDKVTSGLITFKLNLKSKVLEHLNSRYKFAYAKDGDMMFIDANNVKDASIVVLVKTDSSKIYVNYMATESKQ